MNPEFEIKSSYVVVLWLETKKGISMKLMASLASARAEVEAGVVAKAEQHYFNP